MRLALVLALLTLLFASPALAACTNPSSATNGLVVYNSSIHVLQYCDGTVWRGVVHFPGSGGSGCSNPSAAEGKVIYNFDYHVLQYCDGTTWRAAGHIPGAGGSGCANPAFGEGQVLYNSDYHIMQYCDGSNWAGVTGLGWWRNGSTLDLDFVNDRYFLNGTIYNGVANLISGAGATFTRSSVGTYFDGTGTLQTAAANVPRLDYDPVTGAAKGILLEEGRSNYIRNNTMVGAAAGSPGTLPTRWSLTTPNGLTQQIVGTGTQNGISYVDIQLSGTTNAASSTAIQQEATGAISYASGDIDTYSAYLAIVGGSTANITALTLNSSFYDSSLSYLGELFSGVSWIGAPTAMVRYNGSGSVANASAASVVPYVQMTYGNGAAINITLRIGLPQFEKGDINPTSVIATSGSRVTRAPDVFSVPGTAGGIWLTNNLGTLSAVGSFNYQNSGGHGFAGLDNGTNAMDVAVYVSPGLKRSAEVYIGGSVWLGALSPNNSYTPGATTKIAVAFSPNAGGDEGGAADGGAFTDGTVALPSTQSRLTLGVNRGTATTLDGWLQRVWYMPTRQPDSTLTSYTQ